MGGVMVKAVFCVVGIALVLFAVQARDLCRTETTTNNYGETVVARWSGNNWVEEREYRKDGTLYQHRYWDYVGRMHVIKYDAAGAEVISHEVRE